MALNIKDDEIHEMARELADLKGSSLTDAVRLALMHELENARTAQENAVERDIEQLLEIARRCAALPDEPDAPAVTPGRPGSDHSWLYDENGLPK